MTHILVRTMNMDKCISLFNSIIYIYIYIGSKGYLMVDLDCGGSLRILGDISLPPFDHIHINPLRLQWFWSGLEHLNSYF